MRAVHFACLALAATSAAGSAEDLYKRGSAWAAMSADQRATAVGDALTVVVYEDAQATNSTKSDTKRATDIGGSVGAGSWNGSAGLHTTGGFAGGGSVQRSDHVVAQITVVVTGVLPGGDLLVAGRQRMRVNGEQTEIGIEGRVRLADISGDNRVVSSRLADARVLYEGQGFVARSAKPGLVTRVFRLLGLA